MGNCLCSSGGDAPSHRNWGGSQRSIGGGSQRNMNTNTSMGSPNAKATLLGDLSPNPIGDGTTNLMISVCEAELIAKAKSKGKREGIAGVQLSSTAIRNFERPVYEKSQVEAAEIKKIIKENAKLGVLFGHLEEKDVNEIVDAMYKVPVPGNHAIIRQGEPGEAFYIVTDGKFDIYVNRNLNDVIKKRKSENTRTPHQELIMPNSLNSCSFDQKNKNDNTKGLNDFVDPSKITHQINNTVITSDPDVSLKDKVVTVGPGSFFGELALMYNAPRAASVVAQSFFSENNADENMKEQRKQQTATVYALDRDAFRCMVISAQSKKMSLYEGFLSEVELFRDLNGYELSTMFELLESELYDENEIIVQQGDEGDKMFILEEGVCDAHIIIPDNGILRPDEADDGVQLLGDGGAGSLHDQNAEVELPQREIKVKSYTKQGDFFGEVALIKKCKRKATIRAGMGGCSVLALKKEDFDRVIGPILNRDLTTLNKTLIEKYPQIKELFE